MSISASLRPLLAIVLCASLASAQGASGFAPVAPPQKPRLHGLFTRDERATAAAAAGDAAERAVKPMSYARRLASTQPAAQAAGPTLTIDPTQGRHDISPGVYGLNGWGLTTARLQSLRTPVTRWGGNATSEYNWMNDKWSSAGDWYFEIFGQSNGMTPAFDPVTHNHSAFDRFHETNVAAATKTYGTVPILGWIAADVPDGEETCRDFRQISREIRKLLRASC